jgi:hypothetical protein
MHGRVMEPDAEQGCGPMGRFRIQVSYVVWFFILLAIYMAVVSLPTLLAVFAFIDDVFITVAHGITLFLNSALKVK